MRKFETIEKSENFSRIFEELTKPSATQYHQRIQSHSNAYNIASIISASSASLANSERYPCLYSDTPKYSVESLRAHMQYQHEDMNNHRWNVTTTPPTSTSTVNQDCVTTSVSSGSSTLLTTSATTASNNLTNGICDNTNQLIGQNINNTSATAVTASTGGACTPNTNCNTNSTTISPSPLPNLKSPLSNLSNDHPLVDSNNQTKHIFANHHLQQLQLKAESPLNSTLISSSSSSSSSAATTTAVATINNTISAAADSSDNQPSTPQPIGATTQHNPVGNSNLLLSGHQSSIYSTLPAHQYSGQHHLHHPHHPGNHHPQNIITSNQEMHPYPTYMHGYDQFYHPPPPPPTNMDYAGGGGGALYPPTSAGQQSAAVAAAAAASAAAASVTSNGIHDYKSLVPPTRYHPYLSNGTSHASQNSQSGAATTNGNSTNPSSSISNSSLSPRVVSSSSPTQNSLIGQQTQGAQDSNGLNGNGLAQSAGNQPDPSTTPKQCDKCGFVCSTDSLLSEHYSTVHGSIPQLSESLRSGGTPLGGEENGLTNQQGSQSQYPYQQPTYPKDENGSDILDLDSQKMVYPPQHDPLSQDQPLPPMNSMHPMHRPLMWGSEMHGTGNYMTQPPDLNKPYYPNPMKQGYPVIKSEYGVPVKSSEFPPASGFPTQMIKSDYHQTIAPQTRPDMKGFGNEIPNVNNPVSSSPSEFPSTTTPQENGPQFRGFEPPTSSLSTNTGNVKSTTWKSNEARRPKTYNCTACNKWFTSSGHLKRHYNTTLHKNAVKSSGQPDPATMPISAHHHPSRDPNHKSNRRNNAHAQQPPPQPPPEPPRSPEYTPQFTPPPNGFTQQTQFQSYSQQMNAGGIHSTTQQQNSASNGHPNGQAGPSVQASQPRGLLIISSSMEQQINSNSLEQEDQVHSSQMPHSPREELYHHHNSSQDNRQSEIMLPQTNNSNNSPSRSNSNNPHQTSDQQHHQQELQEQQQLHQLRQQQSQHLPTHIISHHHRGPIREDYRLHHQGIPMPSVTSPTIHSTTIHHNSIMDPQQSQQHQYISPLAINTTSPTIHTTSTIIPSYQLQQQQAEHQNYHTIIGNNHLDFSPTDNENSENNLLQINSPFQSSNSMHSTNLMDDSTTSSSSLNDLHHHQQLQQHHQQMFEQTQQQQMQTTVDGNIQVVTTITAVPQATMLNHPTTVEVARISVGGAITTTTTFQENQILPYSPAVPEYMRQSTPNNGERSPQEADIPPSYQLASQPLPSFPYSPTISSTVSGLSFDSINSMQQQQQLQSMVISMNTPPATPTNTSSNLSMLTAGSFASDEKITKKKQTTAAKRRKSDKNSLASHTVGETNTNNANKSDITSSQNNNGKIECIECGKEFAKICYLTQHNKTFHSGEQPFRCQKCGKRFPSQKVYDTHLEKHKAQDKPFKCDKCPKQFHHKTDLRRHRDGHTGYKAHICDTCSKGFCRKDHLRKHSDTHKPKPIKKKQSNGSSNNKNLNNNNNNSINNNNNHNMIENQSNGNDCNFTGLNDNNDILIDDYKDFNDTNNLFQLMESSQVFVKVEN